MKGKSLYSQMFVLPSKACKESLAWADFFLKSCNYSWKEKKKAFVTNRLLGASCNSLYYSFLHNFLLMRWKKGFLCCLEGKCNCSFFTFTNACCFPYVFKGQGCRNDVIDGITMATVLWNNTFLHCYSAHTKKRGLSFKQKQIVPLLNAPMNFAFLKIYRLVWGRKDSDIIYLSVYITLWCSKKKKKPLWKSQWFKETVWEGYVNISLIRKTKKKPWKNFEIYEL